MDAENCPSCGNALVISGLRAKKKKLELVTGILLLLFLCTAVASMIYGGHAEDKKHECYDKIEKINSSLIGQDLSYLSKYTGRRHNRYAGRKGSAC